MTKKTQPSTSQKPTDVRQDGYGLAWGMIVGTGLGGLYDLLLDQFPLGVLLGSGVGVALGLMLDKPSGSAPKPEDDDPPSP